MWSESVHLGRKPKSSEAIARLESSWWGEAWKQFYVALKEIVLGLLGWVSWSLLALEAG